MIDRIGPERQEVAAMNTDAADDASGGSARAVTFVEPMPGFESEQEFTLTPIDEGGYLHSLRSVTAPELRFVVAPADAFFADYSSSLAGVLTEPLAEVLGSRVARLYLVLTIGESLATSTANLRAPLAIDLDGGKAIQVIVDDAALPLQQRLPTAA